MLQLPRAGRSRAGGQYSAACPEQPLCWQTSLGPFHSVMSVSDVLSVSVNIYDVLAHF